MSPENDFNINRVESPEQVIGTKPVDPQGGRKQQARQGGTKKKRFGGQKPGDEEFAEQSDRQIQPEDVDEDTHDEHGIDYRA